MYDVFFSKVKVANNDLLYETDCLCFWQSFFYEFTEVWLTQLSDYVGIIFGCINFMQAQYMRKRLELLKDLNLALE